MQAAGDATLLEILLRNLLQNVLEHCPVGANASVTLEKDRAPQFLAKLFADARVQVGQRDAVESTLPLAPLEPGERKKLLDEARRGPPRSS